MSDVFDDVIKCDRVSEAPLEAEIDLEIRMQPTTNILFYFIMWHMANLCTFFFLAIV